jgi:phenylacetate-CoA ligase
LRGRDLGSALVRYNPVHNEVAVNAYADPLPVIEAISKLDRLNEIRWIHGYPSIVSEFCSRMATHRPDVLERLRTQMKGVLLGSEFPAPHYRQAITDNLGADIVAWYGHSEMCVLAFEDAENEYVPLHAYGWAEGVAKSDGKIHLIGTSYWNNASHFIRYDTGDGIEPDNSCGVLQRFRITDGRIGEFIIDRRGNKIGLTALIFGRHHAGFERARHVQVRQERPGHIQLLLVLREDDLTMTDLAGSFDFGNVEIDVDVQVVKEPVRTRSGKLSLLVE